MGAFLDKPNTEKHNEHGAGNGLRFGLSSMQGWRIEMEDAHTAILGLPDELKDWSFFAVFDGHAGAKVSAHCAEHLLHYIAESDGFKKCTKNNGQVAVENVSHGIKTGFLSLDESMRKMPEMISGEDKSGSTAICCIVSPTHIFFGNCGDSRAVLARDKKVLFSTQDHKPINPKEKERIQNAGGSVMIQRVNGSLAVSRALGDYEYKNVEGKGPTEQLVSPEPEIFVEERADLKDEFLILACDGIWDVMSNDELCEFIRSRLEVTDDLEKICNQVIDTCLYKGSRDNMSIVIVTLPGCVKVSQEAVKKEQELDAMLEKKVKEILDACESPGDVDLSYVMHVLANEDIPGLPPGGGLYAKRPTIEAIFNKLVPEKADNEGIEAEEPWYRHLLKTANPDFK